MLTKIALVVFIVVAFIAAFLHDEERVARIKVEQQLAEAEQQLAELRVSVIFSKIEDVKITDLGNHAYRVTCLTTRCDVSRLNDLFMSFYSGKIDFGVSETGHTGPGWTITVSPVLFRK